MITFGFTRCPDICPTTLADKAIVMKSLGLDADRVQVLFVTVDPERDTLECSRSTSRPSTLGFWGSSATQRAAKEFKIFYENAGP